MANSVIKLIAKATKSRDFNLVWPSINLINSLFLVEHI